MKTLKINKTEKESLSNKEKALIKGGCTPCGCGCYYANSGGSSSDQNRMANNAGGLYSPGMKEIIDKLKEIYCNC